MKLISKGDTVTELECAAKVFTALLVVTTKRTDWCSDPISIMDISSIKTTVAENAAIDISHNAKGGPQKKQLLPKALPHARKQTGLHQRLLSGTRK